MSAKRQIHGLLCGGSLQIGLINKPGMGHLQILLVNVSLAGRNKTTIPILLLAIAAGEEQQANLIATGHAHFLQLVVGISVVAQRLQLRKEQRDIEREEERSISSLTYVRLEHR